MIGATRYTAAAEIARQGRLSADIAKLQEQVSSGKRLAAASDDPAAAARIADLARAQADNAVWARNADTGATVASSVDGKLTTLAAALDRAGEILLAARSETNSPADRDALATEMRGLAQDVAGYADARDPTGAPLFPADPPLALPVSGTLSIAATAPRAAVFGLGATTLQDFLAKAADRLAGGDASVITADIASLDGAIAHVASVRTDQGIRAQRFADARERLASLDTDLGTERSGLEDTDLTYALSAVQSKQLALQAAQVLFAQSHRRTLFDSL